MTKVILNAPKFVCSFNASDIEMVKTTWENRGIINIRDIESQLTVSYDLSKFYTMEIKDDK